MTEKLPTKQVFIDYVEHVADLYDTLFSCGMGEFVREIMLPIAECLLSDVAELGQSSGAEHELDYYTRTPAWTMDAVFEELEKLWEPR